MSSILSTDTVSDNVTSLKNSLTYELQVKRVTVMNLIDEYRRMCRHTSSIEDCNNLYNLIQHQISLINKQEPETIFTTITNYLWQ